MVYVDNANLHFKRMIMCHMIADTTEELLAMAKTIDVHQKHIQNAGTHKEHFDICLERKERALKAGAQEIPFRDLSRMVNEKKQTA